MPERIHAARIGKKAMMKTIEAFIAAFLAFTFIIVALPPDYNFSPDKSDSALAGIEKDDSFRNCVISGNVTCIDAKIRESISGPYDFSYQIYDDPQDEPKISLPEKKVNAFSVVISGNMSDYDPKIFKVYYWTR